jgi:hypothetical protein
MYSPEMILVCRLAVAAPSFAIDNSLPDVGRFSENDDDLFVAWEFSEQIICLGL